MTTTLSTGPPRQPSTAHRLAAEQADLERLQLEHVRERLLRLGAPGGKDQSAVEAAFQEAVAAFAAAPVRAFVPVLVERAVLERLQLRGAGRPGRT
jgi:hypothetical protein